MPTLALTTKKSEQEAPPNAKHRKTQTKTTHFKQKTRQPKDNEKIHCKNKPRNGGK